jgi:predicted nucleotidyltransferase
MNRLTPREHARQATRDRDIAALRAACARAVRDPARIQAVVLFGSLARGDFDGLSDADLAVIGDRSAFDSGVFADFDRAVDIVTLAPARWHAAGGDGVDMVAVIRREAIPVWP